MKRRASSVARLICLALACALVAPPHLVAYAQRTTPRGIAPAVRLVRQSAPPAPDLPDLNSIRQLQPSEPVAPPAIPSTACSPLNPTCQGGGALLRSPYIDSRAAASDSAQLASNIGGPVSGWLKAAVNLPVTDAASGLLATAKKPLSMTGTGAITGAVLVQGGVANSLALNGASDYLEVPNSPSINVTSAFTAEAWVKLNTSTGAYQSVMERFGSPDSSGNNGGFILRVRPDGRLEFYVLRSSQSGYAANGNTLVTAGVWHHVAGVSDGSSMRVYLDGQLDGTLGVGAFPAAGTSNLFVGRGTGAYGYVGGQIDEARLTASALYASDFTPQASLTAGAATRGLWKFDGATANDFSGNGNNAAVRGNPSYSGSVAALANNSVSAGGAGGRVSVPYSQSLDVAGPFTVETWFKIADNSQNQYLVSCLTAAGGYILMANAGEPQLYVTNSAGQGDFAIAWPPDITFGEWHHMAGVFDGSQIRVYLDGALVASKSTTIGPGSFAGGTLSLGAYQNGAAPTNGLIDEVRISQGALYASNFTPKRHLVALSSTRGLWKFDGGTLQDASGNGNDGAFLGGANYSTDVPPPANQPPAVSVASPAQGAGFANDSTINVAAAAADPDGSIAKVEFFANSVKIGESTSAPYSLAWDHVTAGGYSITAQATDNAGATTTSSPVGVTVSQPSVSVAATDANASEQGPDSGVFTVTRTGGTSQPLAVAYSLSGTATNGADYATLSGSVTIPAGASSQTITVTPVDDSAVEGDETVILTLSGGAAYSVGSPVSATVTVADNDTNPPTASVTSPSSGAVFTAPASITITANASDSDGTVTKVEFFSNGTKLGEDVTAPYSFAWNDVAAGSYNLTAVATDNAGATGTSATVNVIVNSAPSVSVTGPAGGTLFTAPAAINITAAASDQDGSIAKVEFFQNGVKIGEDASAPYGFTWSGVAPGGYTLTAVATDDRGAATASAPVGVTVNAAPSVSLTAPAPGAVFNTPALISLSASASDADGSIVKVEFYQGQTKLSEDVSVPFTFDWANVPSGSYTLTAVATDDRGAATTSAPVSVTVNGPPSVSITSPANSAGFTQGSDVTITASAADGDGTVTKVEFYQGSTKLGEDTTAPYSFTWSSPPAGSYSLTAVATDNAGATATSQAVSINVVDFASALLDSANRTGSDDLFSRNFNWGANLVHLPGRAGLDLDVSLSYNSLVWLRSGSAVFFDPDRGFPTPGFRLGLPVIHGPYRNSAAGGATSYVLVTQSGGRVELRQKPGAPNTYESVDSSYARLVGVGGALVLYPGDGSAVTFQSLGGEYQCTGIKDRNGNYVTVAYNSFNRIDKITDTLGREIRFNYDPYQNPVSITQVRSVGGQPQTHTWATFGYESRTIDASFTSVPGLSLFGTVGRPVPMLTQVGLDDGTLYRFTYSAKGQVVRVTRAAQVSPGQQTDLSYVSYQMSDDGSDCPRFVQSAVWAKDWNDGQEVTTTYGREGDWQTATAPDGTVEKMLYGTAGWRRGLVLGTETWGAVNNSFDRRRWTSTTWTQDDEALAYALNPRVMESSVSDSGNSRRTAVEYLTPQESEFRLPKKVSEFKGSDTTPLRYTETDYELGYDYVETAYIVGLVKERRLKDGAGALQSRAAYAYDTPGCVINQAGAVRHDDNYDNTIKRGALCTVTRYKTDPSDTQSSDSIVAARMTYDSLGSTLSASDALDHKTTAGYQDNFADGAARSTYAYPTSTTHADQNARPAGEPRLSATVTYDFDTGAAVRARDVKGAEVVSEFDAAGRATKITRRDGVNNLDAGYVRLIYSPGQDFAASFTQVDVNVESFSVQVLDGAGRVRAAAADHPNTAGGYSAQTVSYNSLGQTVRRYSPTEVNSSWLPAGDDSQSGWLFSSQTYDWKGRPLVTINTDGTQKTASYEGCGCAGGDVTTLTDEAGRRQKVYRDVLGRVIKIELLNKDDSYSVYSAKTNKYDARDQVVRTRAYVGAAPSPEPSGEDATYETAAMTYDGYGRLRTSKAPEQSIATTYTYFDDDATKSVTDARGVTTNFTYDERHLVTGVSYDRHGLTSVSTEKPNGTGSIDVADTPAVTYSYDAAGNRASMTTANGAGGGVTYDFDALSRLKSETRTFPGLSGSFTLSYDYTVAGQVKLVTDQWAGTSFTNSYDAAGQMTGVSGTGFEATTTSFAAQAQYRAWGALKSVSYGNGTSLGFGYDARGLPMSYAAGGVKDAAGQPVAQGATYLYNPDGRVRFSADLTTPNGVRDRGYSYDHVGRIAEAYSGAQARAFRDNTTTADESGPFRQSYQYDAWGDRTSRTGRFWSEPDDDSQSYDSRGRNTLWEYDADGRFISRNEPSPNGLAYEPLRQAYDAAGRLAKTTQKTSRQVLSGGVVTTRTTQVSTYEGDGLGVKRATTTQLNNGTPTTKATYYLRSSVLGGKVISEYDSAGVRQNSYVYAGGEMVAQQQRIYDGTLRLLWQHTDPVTGDALNTDGQGKMVGKTTLDPDGVDVGDADPFTQEGGTDIPEPIAPVRGLSPQFDGGVAGPGGVTCNLDGVETNCSLVKNLIDRGAAKQCPQNDCGPRTIINPSTRRPEVQPLRWDPNGGGLGYFWHEKVSTPYTDTGKVTDQGDPIWSTEMAVINHFSPAASDPLTGLTFIGSGGGGVVFKLVGGQVSRHVKPWKQWKPPNMTSACGKFATSLASRLYNTNIIKQPYGEPGDDGNLVTVAVSMRSDAIDNVDENGNPYRKGKTPIDGFKDELTRYGQDADVYHHILFVAGNVLNGYYGATLNEAFIAYDWQQAERGRKESQSELEDDYAGERVGRAMLKTGQAGRSGDYDALARQIAHILCK